VNCAPLLLLPAINTWMHAPLALHIYAPLYFGLFILGEILPQDFCKWMFT
jgi:hypothetical protein